MTGRILGRIDLGAYFSYRPNFNFNMPVSHKENMSLSPLSAIHAILSHFLLK